VAKKTKQSESNSDEIEATLPEVEAEVTKTEIETKKESKKEKSKGISGFAAFAANAQKKWGDNVAIASTLSNTGIPRISWGNIGLDIATFGGCPRGRMVRLWGHPKSAKTGSALTLVAEWQKHCSECFERGPCKCKNREKAGALWVDAEGRSLDNLGWMEAHGIDMSRLIVQRPPTGEQVIDMIDAALRDEDSGIGLIVLDSIAHVVSSKELDKATEDGESMAVNAKLMNLALRKWTSAFTTKGLNNKKQPTLILLNQIRSKVGFHTSDTMPGGRGLDFSTSLDIKFHRKDPHYILNTGTDEEPTWVDKAAGGAPGSFKPSEDAQPDYVEIEYKVTESSVCPKGRYGIFNYWLRPTHGHRAGDPDNGDRIFQYAKNYDYIKKGDGGYNLKHLKESTFDKLRDSLCKDVNLQNELWAEIVEKLKK
jgi:RecA/RadA recombinase